MYAYQARELVELSDKRYLDKVFEQIRKAAMSGAKYTVFQKNDLTFKIQDILKDRGFEVYSYQFSNSVEVSWND